MVSKRYFAMRSFLESKGNFILIVMTSFSIVWPFKIGEKDRFR